MTTADSAEDEKILIFVESIKLDSVFRPFSLEGFDFGREFCGAAVPWNDDPIFAITTDGVRTQVEPPQHVHRFSAGFAWIIKRIQDYPNPPFLLTSSKNMRLVWSADVAIQPTDRIASDILPVILAKEVFAWPVAGDGWYGWLTMDTLTTGSLIAFSESTNNLPGRLHNVVDPSANEPFGKITPLPK